MVLLATKGQKELTDTDYLRIGKEYAEAVRKFTGRKIADNRGVECGTCGQALPGIKRFLTLFKRVEE